MDWRRAISRGISDLVALGTGHQAPPPGFRVLMYHAVGTPVPDDRLGINNISAKRFKEHMSMLRNQPELQLVSFAAGDVATIGPEVAITFDDGFKDNLYVAAPILQELQIPFTVFVAANLIGSGRQEYLTGEELRQLATVPGASIGAHGANHVALTQCDDAQLAAELSQSRQQLEDLLGQPVSSMSYPFGAVDWRVRCAVAEAGYVRAGTSRMDLNHKGRDPLLLCRTFIDTHDDQQVLKQKINGSWDWYRNRCRDVTKP